MTEYRPERKIVAAAVATILIFVAQLVIPDLDVPPGVEGAVAVLAGYFVPNAPGS